MPTLSQIEGLKASDRTPEDQIAIKKQAGENAFSPDSIHTEEVFEDISTSRRDKADTPTSQMLNSMRKYDKHLDEQYQKALEENKKKYHVERENSVSGAANELLDKVAREVSSYYKKYNGTDYLPLTETEKKELAAQYEAKKDIYGENNANIWLDKQFKEKVAENQSWFEQMINGIGHLAPAIEGGAIQAFGNVYGALAHIANAEGYNENDDLNWWHSFWDDVLDNPITRYGRDVQMAGASHVLQGLENVLGISDESANERIEAMKNTATRYNPNGIGADAIVTTEEQDNKLISGATPWQALQSGGFTALSMLAGAGEAKVAGWLFGGAKKGAVALSKSGHILKKTNDLKKALTGIKKMENFVDTFIIPAAVGTMEGGIEGLNTKIDLQNSAVQELDDFYKEKIDKEVEALLNDDTYNPLVDVTGPDGNKTYTRLHTPEEVYQEVWNKYRDEYNDARRQIDVASSKAGIHNFFVNSAINGAINQTLKAGIHAPKVQEALRNNKMFSWAYRKPKYVIDEAGKATAKYTKWDIARGIIKEPLGEGLEEYEQSVSNDVFTGAAQNNINEFIKNRFDPNGTVAVGDTFGSEYAAAWTAFKGSLVSKESVQSAILGAVSSTMGTVGGIGRGYHKDENGRVVQNRFDINNLKRGLNKRGEAETTLEYISRIAPWRSGAINSIFDIREEMAEANETAEALTEWLKDPQNKAKWDGLTGTANWMRQIEKAAQSNDEFSYRNSLKGKAINDVFLLNKLKGTDFYDSIIKELQRVSTGQVTQEEIEGIKNNTGEDYQNTSDNEIVERMQSNANKMLGLMSSIENEEKDIDRLVGRVDEDTKQSLIFGKLMLQDFTERKEALEKEVNSITSSIKNSRTSNGTVDDDLKALILKYGSVNKVIEAQSKLEETKNKIASKIEELKNIDKSKLSDQQKADLKSNEDNLKKINLTLKQFDTLYEKDDKGNRTDELKTGIYNLIVNERDIMNMDATIRGLIVGQGSTKFYNSLHQDKQKVDQLNLEINELEHQIDLLKEQNNQWMENGRVKKGHNKQVQRNSKKIEDLTKQKDAKMRILDAEQGSQSTKPIYSSEQQAVIDNLIQQGTAIDKDFLNKVVDMARLESSIKNYHSQYVDILSNPRAFSQYVDKQKRYAELNLLKRRVEAIANIKDFKEYSQELSKLMADIPTNDVRIVKAILKDADAKAKREWMPDEDEEFIENSDGTFSPVTPIKSNFDRFNENIQKHTELVSQFNKNENLTNNDKSLLLSAMEFLSSKGVDLTDREAAVEALIEKDEQGNQGGLFRQWVENKNSAMPAEVRQYMPVYTSIGQVVSDYVDIINGRFEDIVNRDNTNPVIQMPQTPEAAPVTAPETPSKPSGFNIEQPEEKPVEEKKPALQSSFEKVTTPQLAEVVRNATEFIDSSNADEADKERAMQSLQEIADSGESYQTIDDLLTAVSEKIDDLNKQSEAQENKDDNPYKRTAALLNKVYANLNIAKYRRPRSQRMPSSRSYSDNLNFIYTADIAYMESKNPQAWAVQFSNQHRIDEWNRMNHPISRDEPVYFITDSEWTATVTQQMDNTEGGKKYNTLKHMPIVIAVKVNEKTDTTIEVNGQYYQPIGILPGADSNKDLNPGARMTEEIRNLASKEQGTHLVTRDGMPNSIPLTTRVTANYSRAHYPGTENYSKRNNSPENNKEVTDLIIKDFISDMYGIDEVIRIMSLSPEERSKDEHYQKARNEFVKKLEWTNAATSPDHLDIHFVPDSYRKGSKASPIGVLRKDMADTKSIKTGRSLLDVLKEGTGEDVELFNSRTERLYNEVIKHLFEEGTKDDEIPIITEDMVNADPDIYKNQCERLTNILNGIRTRGVNDFIYINPTSGWSFLVTSPDNVQIAAKDKENSKTVFKVLLVNNDKSIPYIDLATIDVGNSKAEVEGRELLRNIMFDSTTGQIRDFLKWQIPQSDIQNINNQDKAKADYSRRNIASIVDDGIITIAGESLKYNWDGVEIETPITSDGNGHTRVLYTEPETANPNNATSPAPINNTPLANGSIMTKDGKQVEADSGAQLNGETANPINNRNEAAKNKAAAITRKIVEDSEKFKLSKDEKYYYIVDKSTGQETKYLRVTTVIGADVTSPQVEITASQVIKQLKKKGYTLKDLNKTQIESLKTNKDIADALGLSYRDILRAKAEIRTEYKNTKYGEWGTPSTAIGNTFDSITRDFLSGKLKEKYPNISQNVFDEFKHQLELFKTDCDANGITLIPEGVVAHGTITMTDSEGNKHNVNVAGTLDLLGYDDNGNFYIYDMKTTRNHSNQKLADERLKWSKQVSMYADLLKQSLKSDYPEFNISPDKLFIIPININYPAPIGTEKGLDPNGPVYSVNDKQLQMQYRGKDKTDFILDTPKGQKESNGDNAVGMRKTDWEQYRPGYTPFNINWDNLSSEDQDIANTIESQVKENESSTNITPKTAEITQPAKRKSYIDKGDFGNDEVQHDKISTPPPVTHNGLNRGLPSWSELSNEAMKYIQSQGWADNEGDYRKILNSPEDAQLLEEELRNCVGVIFK